jgi:hypothetical protein
VRASVSDIDHISLDCDCPFWRWNGPEFHAKSNQYALGPQRGSATSPDVRDPDKEFFVCKHAHSVISKMDDFISEIVDKNWEMDDDDLLNLIDEEWIRLSK